ncbi:hypothetical protein Rhopal_005572-T1 [Rhodotorula paludigena]|uniref:Uncharacterized protein n=1 Tax=Rhodotorula paludigena TaxID=86838 RepID=A0AAV5GU24_9BASI|nr:hypothetical protein Rhopal_005572-T1 [Rhodotorula paludigena]
MSGPPTEREINRFRKLLELIPATHGGTPIFGSLDALKGWRENCIRWNQHELVRLWASKKPKDWTAFNARFDDVADKVRNGRIRFVADLPTPQQLLSCLEQDATSASSPGSLATVLNTLKPKGYTDDEYAQWRQEILGNTEVCAAFDEAHPEQQQLVKAALRKTSTQNTRRINKAEPALPLPTPDDFLSWLGVPSASHSLGRYPAIGYRHALYLNVDKHAWDRTASPFVGW